MLGRHVGAPAHAPLRQCFARARFNSHVIFYGSAAASVEANENARPSGRKRPNKYIILRQRIFDLANFVTYAVFGCRFSFVITCRCFPYIFFIPHSHSANAEKKVHHSAWNSDGDPHRKRLTRNVYLGVYRRKQNFADVRPSVYIEKNRKQSKLQCKQSNRSRALALAHHCFT